MNAIEIEEAVSDLAASPCDIDEFPFAFLTAFGNKDVTIKKLRVKGKSTTNKSDVEGGVLQRLNIHIAVAGTDRLDDTLIALRDSPQTSKAKAKYVLATDGVQVIAEELATGEVLSCEFSELGNHFGFFLTLAGISAVREVKDNPIDIKATSRLNKLYVELLKSNPDWATSDKQIVFNQFLARLVFCFFAEDTGVFTERGMFTSAIQLTDADGSNTHVVIKELFDAMDSDPREGGRIPPVKSWADKFPYVNGGLFSGATECPIFTRTARSYLIRAGELDWQAINPDIFGSMIQAVADDEERGSLGMHYTSVPNIEKVLNPLFLDSLNEQLEVAGDNARKLLNLQKRLANIRVFDPACGSGNFLVIAYIRMREIEAELMKRRGEPMNESSIQLTQFYGIEIKPFAVEVARLSLLIAEFQCNVRLIGQMQAQMLILPLHATGHVVIGNALRMDWYEICPQSEEHETFICGNPPYKGSQTQTKQQKKDLEQCFSGAVTSVRQIDYVGGWFYKAACYQNSLIAFVSTNSICQGRIVPVLWPCIYKQGVEITFAYESFRWTNLASHNAGVTVTIIGLGPTSGQPKKLYSIGVDDDLVEQTVKTINSYLIPSVNTIVNGQKKPLSKLSQMSFGNMPIDAGQLLLTRTESEDLSLTATQTLKYVRRIYGSSEFIRGSERYCLWIKTDDLVEAEAVLTIKSRIDQVREKRLESTKSSTVKAAETPHLFAEIRQPDAKRSIIVPSVSSESREYLPVGLLNENSIVSNLAFALFDAPLWNMALIASKIHLVWIGTVCGKMKTDFRYSNTLGWNTFPVPNLTEQNKADLTQCAENILLAREAHFPATIADLYKPDEMPPDLRAAHEHNDETLERIYIGRRFKNDTERLERLFALYTEMTKESA